MDTPREYKPELIPRKGEWTAWILALVVLITYVVLRWRVQNVPGVTLILVVFLLISASIISFGNWIDRKTLLRLREDGVEFRNGLRNVFQKWDDIQEVRVIPSQWGKQVQVLSTKAHFVFRTLGEVTYKGELRGRMGFTEGKEILDHIIKSSGLIESAQTDQGYYYLRP